MTAEHPDYAESMDLDEDNEAELAAHAIAPDEVEEIWINSPVWVRNKKHRAGDWKMMGRTKAGRPLTIIIRYDVDRRSLRPITGWVRTDGESSMYFRKENGGRQ